MVGRQGRSVILGGVFLLGCWFDHSAAGGIYAVVLFGIVAFLVYLAADAYHALASFLDPAKRQNVTNYTQHNELHIDGPAIRGNADPTSPNHDWRGFVEAQHYRRIK